MDRSASDPRRMSVKDFPAEQVAGWIDAGSSGRSDEAEPDADAPTEWFVAYTNPRREEDVARTVRRRACEVYVPVMTVTVRRADVSRPLLPRYVFIGLRGQSLYVLRETPGLEGVVRMGGSAVTVRHDMVTGLRAQEEEGVFDFTAARLRAKARAEAAERYPPGRAVWLRTGPFSGFNGIVDRMLDDDRISVFMTIFGRTWPVPMKLADIEAR